jgi:hypothetical protein
MMYPTLRATVRKGKIQLLDKIHLPEDALVLVTVIDDAAFESLTLGERMAVGLQDILLGRTTGAQTEKDLALHLDKVFQAA